MGRRTDKQTDKQTDRQTETLDIEPLRVEPAWLITGLRGGGVSGRASSFIFLSSIQYFAPHIAKSTSIITEFAIFNIY